MMPKSVKRFSDDIMLLFDLEGTCRLKTKKPPGMAAVRILLLQSSDRAQSSRRQRAPKVPICGGQVDHEAHIVDAEALVTCPDAETIRDGRSTQTSSSLGGAGAKLRRGDPGIHSVTLAEWCSGAEFRTAATLRSRGMDPRVCAASLRSLLRPWMTK
ncbi:hypothetical protein EN962_28070 [Mesorhizobium sp. M7A.F.Ca.CA.001.09.2.1]|nr:hypothetical protein EN980_05530 [Mesorhizobium sp. M7A.F.Ca.CA.001.13.1.1]RUY72818.1 hypothetical protein EN962_28070 [Mesorhizobium sp. M7A.F.Ca.CA.001.09.2.1]RUY74351.1 hypothetical protein EN965_01480 [Mesorhizobium sp. M7A.F.Ca.CA.001.05.1.1]RUZ07110.1 hypothetical protein EN955_12845 [Mesorhizobium sp. M7A.F.Ca.CA.001.04.2.1]RUZ22411.1 hypothetical protein EN961_11095 [Mesorhizobium sp. M7A.F.Ca.CA.001.09.1.1]RUZ36724.1 hypothetical protein EN953_02755 [Mesorhizobium sp. M7A.F.Ca.CA.0